MPPDLLLLKREPSENSVLFYSRSINEESVFAVDNKGNEVNDP